MSNLIKKINNSIIILGIDPGTTIMGYGIIRIESKNIEVLMHGEIQLSKYEDHFEKLNIIFTRISGLIEQYNPNVVAAEAPFFGQNVQSMLKLGRAQGVALAAALQKNIPVFEYSPRKIKQAITGNGNATKEQVALMLLKQNYITEIPKNLDATDGLAVALCHFYQNKIGSSNTKKNASSWEAYINQNENKIVKRNNL